MGILKEGRKLLDIALINSDIIKPTMFEFGNQHFHTADVGFEGSVKKYFEELGLYHVSVDLNGEDGALPYDMSEEDVLNLGKFDIVTDFGSSEHVEPFYNQYKVFKNLFDLCKIGGIIIHHVPLRNTNWITHSPAQYTLEFFDKLYNSNSSFLHRNINENLLISVAVKKVNDRYLSVEEFPVDLMAYDDNPNREYVRFNN